MIETDRRLSILVRLGWRVIIAGGVLLAGTVLALLATRIERPELIAIAAAAPLGALALLRGGRTDVGVLAIVLIAATVRWGLPTGTQSRIPLSLVATAAVLFWWISKDLLTKRRISLLPAATNLPLFGFIVACLISYVWGLAFRDVLVSAWASWPVVQLGALALMILLPGAYLLAANQLRDTRALAWLTGIIVAIGAVAIVFDMANYPLDFLQTRPMFPTWIVCLCFALAITNKRMPLLARIALLALATAWLYRMVVVQLSWLSAWIPTVLALLVAAALRSKVVLLVVILIVAIYLGINWSEFVAARAAEQTTSGDTRLQAWQWNWRVTGQHWLFGTGPAGYAVYYMSYYPEQAMATHSNYVDILSQLGLVGMAFFAWLFGSIGWTLWKLWRLVRGRGDFVEAFTLAICGGYVAVVVAMALGDWIVPFVYTQTISGFDYALYSWVLLGAGQALYQIVRREREGGVEWMRV